MIVAILGKRVFKYRPKGIFSLGAINDEASFCHRVTTQQRLHVFTVNIFHSQIQSRLKTPGSYF